MGGFAVPGASTTLFNPSPLTGMPGGARAPRGYRAVPPLDPGLTSDFFGWLRSQVGQGATPFNLQSWLPSSGELTGPGQLTAPMNEYLAQLQNFFLTGQGGGPGFDILQQMSQSGMPIDVMPAWQAMTEAQQRSIEQGAANLREQFAFAGNLAGSPFGTASADYWQQSGADQRALLAAMTQQASEAARGRQFGASQFLGGAGMGLGEYLQNLDQASIDRMWEEFVRTQPEYSPLLGLLMQGATTFPPTVKKPSVGLGGLGGFLSGIGGLAGGLSKLWPLLFAGAAI